MPKTTAQLNHLVKNRNDNELAVTTLEVSQLLESAAAASSLIASAIETVQASLLSGKDVLVMTSRKLIVGKDGDDSLSIGAKIADALVALVQQLTVRPRYIIAKVSLIGKTHTSIGSR